MKSFKQILQNSIKQTILEEGSIEEKLNPNDFPANFKYGDKMYVFDRIAGGDRAVYYNSKYKGDKLVFGSKKQMEDYLGDYTSPKGGTQSSQFEESVKFGLPPIEDVPGRYAASELLKFLRWPESFYEKIDKVKDEDTQLKLTKRLVDIQRITEEIKKELENKNLYNEKDLADAFLSYVKENPFGEEKEEHSLDWYTQTIETTLQMGEPEGSIAVMDDLISHLAFLFSIVQEFPEYKRNPIGFKFESKMKKTQLKKIIKEEISKTLKEDTRSTGTVTEIQRFLRELKTLKDKYHNIVGDDSVFDGLNSAERAATELMMNAPENRSDL